MLSIVAARGSVASFIEVTGEFVGKDVDVVRSMAEECGTDLGALDNAVKVIDVAGRI